MFNVVAGIALTAVVIVAQAVLPFAFDFVSTLAIYGAGVWLGRNINS